MPPRVRLTADEAQRLPDLLSRVEALRSEFPSDADPSALALWVRDRYFSDDDDATLSLNLVTLVLFEHGVHRSVDSVARDLAILREESIHTNTSDGRT